MRMEKAVAKISGIDYSYNPDESYEKDGHIYCKKCNERLDGNLIEVLNQKFISRNPCRCEREENERKKQREERQHIANLKEMCFISCIQYGYKLDDFYDKTSNAYIASKNYVENYQEMKRKNIGLLFYGTVGTGKSFLASAIANAVIETFKERVLMRNLSQIINDLQQGGFDLDKNKYIERLASVPLLILDDLGIERNTSYALEQVYNVINSRCLGSKPTIITTNLPLEEINNTESRFEYKRIYSRVLEMCVPVMVVGEDYRKQIAKEKIREAKSLLLGMEV